MNEQQIEQQMDARINARMSRDYAAFERMAKREEAAEEMIGQLGSGKFYVYPVGGKYREGSKQELVSFLIRNNYA